MLDKHIRMAILDDGVHPKVCPLKGSFLIDDDLSVTVLEENIISPYSHGSICARIVQRYTDLNRVDVFSIQILRGDTWRGNIDRLLKAFELCISLDIRLIHLSVGTYAFEDFAKLEETVRGLLDSNRFLVAAAGNRGTVTYPAYLPGVIGVRYHPELTGGEYVYYSDPFTRIHFQVSAKHKLICRGKEVETPISNSYAAPLITAKILSYLKGNTDMEKTEVMRLLINNAGHYTPIKSSEACVYPPVRIPVVVLSGFSVARLARLIEFLMNCLRRDDYHARAATNLSGIRPWDETALPEPIDLDMFIMRMAWYFSCEIILLGITTYIPFAKYENISLGIYGDESSGVATVSELGDIHILWAAELSDVKVYELIMTILT